MGIFSQNVRQGVQTPETLAGKPDVSTQSLCKATVLYHLTSVNLYVILPTEGPDATGQARLACDMTSMSPYGGGASGGAYLFPGTRVFYITTATTGYVNNSMASGILTIVAIDNEIPAADRYYYPLWYMTYLENIHGINGVGFDLSVSKYLGFDRTDRLRGKPGDMSPGDWSVGNPLKGYLYVGGGRVSAEASPVTGLHLYTTGDTVVFNKGITYIEDQPWKRKFSMLDSDGQSLTGETVADSTEEAIGQEYGSQGAFTPNPGDDLNVASGTTINVNASKPLWSELNYNGYSVGGRILQRVVKTDKTGSVQPGTFSFNGVDGSRIEGGAHSVTLSRSSDLPYLEMTRELDSEEPEQNNDYDVLEDVTTEDFNNYSTQYADLMYELMKQRFVERYWAKQKANNKDWKALSMAEVAQQMGRAMNDRKLTPIGEDEPAYKDKTDELTDPLTENGKTFVSQLESYIHLSPTGAIIISDGTGSEIRMEGGNIILSPAVDFRIQPGRDMSATVPRFASLFAGKRVDIASDKDEVTIHANKNATVSAEGLVAIESRGRTAVSSSDPNQRGEGGGVIIRSATDTSILGHNIRLSLQNATDDSKTGQKPVADGMMIFDASESSIFMAGDITSHGNRIALLTGNASGITLSDGIFSVAAARQQLFGQSFIMGYSSFQATWKDPRTGKENVINYTSDNTKGKPSMTVNGNIIAGEGINAKTIAGSNGVFTELHSFNGRETESLFVPADIKAKYKKNIETYSTFTTVAGLRFDYSAPVTAWLTANANNPAITAYGSKRLGIYYPNAAGYNQASSFWTMSRWQRNLATVGGATWQPKNILDADNKPMLPYPGYESWTKNNFAVTWSNDGTTSAKPMGNNWVINCTHK